MDQKDQSPTGGEGEGTAADRAGSAAVVDGGPDRAGGVASDPLRASVSPDGTSETGREGAAPGAGHPGEDAAGAGEQPPGNDRPPSPEKARNGRGATAFEISRALTAAGGDRGFAAAALGITRDTLAQRIADHPQLRALWSKAGADDANGAPPPRQGEVLNRKPIDLPDVAPSAVELAEMVSEADKKFHDIGLKKLGASEKLLQRIRDLDGLATTTGGFIAISLEKTSRSYYLQVMELMETAQELRGKLMAKPGEPGHISDDEARAFFNKNYVDMVKEAGRAYELMLTGAEAMVRMMQATREDDAPGGALKKPKWGRVKKAEVPDA